MTSFFKIHAAAVVRNGAATALLGCSRAGKSTLTVRLMEEGFSVLSDDVALVHPRSLCLYPYARPVFLRESAWELFPRLRPYLQPKQEDGQLHWRLDPGAEGLDCRADPAPICAVVHLEEAVLGQPPRLQPISQTDAMVALVVQSMNLVDFGSSGVDVLIGLVRRSRLFRLHNGDLDTCASALTAALP